MIITPTLEEENKLWSQGLLRVGGVDEAGRGSWAGPVVAAVVVLPKDHIQMEAVRDSKMVTPKKREELYEFIVRESIDFGVGIISNRVIDKVGIGEATKLAAKDAYLMLQKPLDYLLIDAIDLTNHCECKQQSFIRGDQKIYSISCASIIAKVTRDNLMASLGGEYKKYEFQLHKGYGTKRHQELLALHGPSDIHRYSYKPLKRYM